MDPFANYVKKNTISTYVQTGNYIVYLNMYFLNVCTTMYYKLLI